jgi:hypothetical protein
MRRACPGGTDKCSRLGDLVPLKDMHESASDPSVSLFGYQSQFTPWSPFKGQPRPTANLNISVSTYTAVCLYSPWTGALGGVGVSGTS